MMYQEFGDSVNDALVYCYTICNRGRWSSEFL